MKKLLIVLALLVVVTGVFASGASENGSHWLPAEGVTGSFIISDGQTYSIAIDQIAAVQLYSDTMVSVFLKGNDRSMTIMFETRDESQKFIAEVYKRMASIRVPKVK